jgi:hypothetical protein
MGGVRLRTTGSGDFEGLAGEGDRGVDHHSVALGSLRQDVAMRGIAGGTDDLDDRAGPLGARAEAVDAIAAGSLGIGLGR